METGSWVESAGRESDKAKLERSSVVTTTRHVCAGMSVFAAHIARGYMPVHCPLRNLSAKGTAPHSGLKPHSLIAICSFSEIASIFFLRRR